MRLYRFAHMSPKSAKYSGILSILFLGISCTHVEPALVTRDSIVLTDKSFVATAEVMHVLQAQLTPEQWQRWVAFEQRFKTSFHTARILYDDAIAAQLAALATDGGTAEAAAAAENLKAAESLINSFTSQLDEFQALVSQLAHPDGGTS